MCSQVSLHYHVFKWQLSNRSRSHLLARRGLARRVSNLVGQLQFSDYQLQRTQKGLKEAGVPMPNFGNVGRELAKEINEEPEEEPETEDERKLISASMP